MSASIRKHLEALKSLKKATTKRRKNIIKESPPELIRCISECCYNCLNSALPLKKAQFSKLRRHKTILRRLASKKLSIKAKKKIINQRGGFIAPLLTALLTAVASKILQT
jgi:hypothetical protein